MRITWSLSGHLRMYSEEEAIESYRNFVEEVNIRFWFSQGIVDGYILFTHDEKDVKLDGLVFGMMIRIIGGMDRDFVNGKALSVSSADNDCYYDFLYHRHQGVISLSEINESKNMSDLEASTSGYPRNVHYPCNPFFYEVIRSASQLALLCTNITNDESIAPGDRREAKSIANMLNQGITEARHVLSSIR